MGHRQHAATIGSKSLHFADTHVAPILIIQLVVHIAVKYIVTQGSGMHVNRYSQSSTNYESRMFSIIRIPIRTVPRYTTILCMSPRKFPRQMAKILEGPSVSLGPIPFHKTNACKRKKSREYSNMMRWLVRPSRCNGIQIITLD